MCVAWQGNPQPLDAALLHKVLKQNYYSIFYPSSRDNLNTSVPGNPWAVTCKHCASCPAGTTASVLPPPRTAASCAVPPCVGQGGVGKVNRKFQQGRVSVDVL